MAYFMDLLFFLGQTQQSICAQQFFFNGQFEWTGLLAWRFALRALRNVVSLSDARVFFHAKALLAIIFVVHGVAEHVVNGNIRRAGRQTSSATRATIVVSD